LRNSPRLPEKTRLRIRALARQLGYRPNPLVSAFVQRRRSLNSARFQGTLAFITRSVQSNQTPLNFTSLSQAIAARANELGFKLDSFDLADYAYQPRKLERVLRARSIYGLIFAPVPKAGGDYDFSWEHFAGVNLSSSGTHSSLDTVEFNHYEGARLAMRECEQRGYRRPGYVSLALTDERTRGRWRAGYLTHPVRVNRFCPAPPLVADRAQFRDAFVHWWTECRPDVLIGNRSALIEALKALHAMKINRRDGVGVVELNIHSRQNRHTGVYVCRKSLCAVATDFLTGKLYRNEFGLPSLPQQVLLPPLWHEGTTLPERLQ